MQLNETVIAAAVGAISGGIITLITQLILRWYDRKHKLAETDSTEGTGKKVTQIGSLFSETLRVLQGFTNMPYLELETEIENANDLIGVAKAIGMPEEFIEGTEAIRKALDVLEKEFNEVNKQYNSSNLEACLYHVGNSKIGQYLKQWGNAISVPMRVVYEMTDRRIRFKQRLNRSEKKNYRSACRQIAKLAAEIDSWAQVLAG